MDAIESWVCDAMTAAEAQEMAAVGILPTEHEAPIGARIMVGDQPFIVTGYATAAEFIATVAMKCGVRPENVKPTAPFFVRLSTD